MKIKYKSYILPIFLGVLSSLLIYIQTVQKIEEYSNNTNTVVFKETILNRLFVVTDFTKYEYMEGNQIYHYLGPFFMYFLAIYLSESTFLNKSKKYLQFIAARVNTQNNLTYTITRNIYIRPLIFLLVYNLTILVLTTYNNYSIEYDYKQLLMQSIYHIITQYFIVIGISSISSLIYLKWNGVFALTFSLLLLSFLIMIDVYTSSINLLFYDESFIKVEGILFGILLFTSTYIIFYLTRIEID